MRTEASDSRRRRMLAHDQLCDEFEAELREGRRPRIEEFLPRVPEPERPALFRALLASEMAMIPAGEDSAGATLENRFPEWGDLIDAVRDEVAAEIRGMARLHPVYVSAMRYEIQEPHKQGGLGVVSIARDERLGRVVAVKEIQPWLADNPEVRKRFEFEARLTGLLDHPGVVPVHSLGKKEDGRPYFVTKLVRGETLKQAIRNLHSRPVWARGRVGRDGRSAVQRLLRRFLAVCQTVSYAHSKGVIHRDLKPDNIMLGDFGETLVIDWGLAKPLREDSTPGPTDDAVVAALAAGRGDATSPQSQVGTVHYASPEQLRGDAAAISPASDVYSLGATLFHLIAGRSPFHGQESAEVVRREVLQGRLPSPRQVNQGIPRALDAICRKAMALDPARRYSTAAALAEDLENWLDGEPVRAHRDSLPEQAWRWTTHHRVLAASAATALCFLIAFGAFRWYRLRLETALADAEIERLEKASLGHVAALTGSLARNPTLASERVSGRLDRARDMTARRNLTLALARLDPARCGPARETLRDDPGYRLELARSLLGPGSGAESAAPDSLRWLLRPLREELFDCLLTVQSGDPRTNPESKAAGPVLLDYASDRPDVLAWALSYADDEEFLRHLEPLRRTPEAARTALSAVLVEHGALEFKEYRDPHWSEPSTDDLKAIEDAQGFALPQALWCQTMPRSQFLAISESLRAAGYRPARFRPVSFASDAPVAAIWYRDAAQWRLAEGLTAEEALRRDAAMGDQGFECADVALNPGPDPQHPVYHVLWVRTNPEVDLAFRLHARSFRESQWPDTGSGRGRLVAGLLVDEALREGDPQEPVVRRFGTIQCLWRPDGGIEVGAILSRSDVWHVFFPITWGSEAAVRDREGHRLLQADVSRLPGPRPGEADRYLATWKEALDRRTTFLAASDARTHRERARAIAAKGGIPVSLHTAAGQGGNLVTTSVWASLTPHAWAEWPARWRVRSAVALFLLGDPGPLRAMLKSSPDPTERSWLIESRLKMGIDARTIADEFHATADTSARAALLQAAGNGDRPEEMDAFLDDVLALAAGDPDPGLRASARWAIGRWGLGAELAARDAKLGRGMPAEDSARRWFVNEEGIEFAIVRGPVTARIGGTTAGAEGPGFSLSHPVRIARDFAIGTTELTVAAYQRHLDDSTLSPRPERISAATKFGKQSDAPALALSFYDAARYCNWLSRRCGIPRDQWCFEDDGHGSLRLAPNYLERTGYRLPTEAEWEFACRAGSETSRFHSRGSKDADPLLVQYAWCIDGNARNLAHPVGRLKPNDLGLFDTLGNAHEWCMDPILPYCTGMCDEIRPDREWEVPLSPEGNRVLRGGWFHLPASGVTSTNRSWNKASYSDNETGFRPARTLRPR